MINKNNTCLIEDCSIQPCFNFKGEKKDCIVLGIKKKI
jgi:hypothetical protein